MGPEKSETSPGSRGSAPDVRPERESEPSLVAYYTGGTARPTLVGASATRDWMQATDARFAQRCLPMLIANQAGWWILNRTSFRASWDGSNAPAGVRVAPLDRDTVLDDVGSQFGYGILTWSFPLLFRTSPGYNLLVRGPANLPKPNIVALEGVVETDWAVASFTMNWQFTRAAESVEFAKDEPICMLVPQRRGELESFRPLVRNIEDAPELAAQHAQWEEQRELHMLLKRAAVKLAGPEHPDARTWQGDYFRGESPGGAAAAEHQTRLAIRPFAEADADQSGPKQ